MKLTATQRNFLSDQLGVKARQKKLLHVRSGTERKDDAISEAFEDYLRREAKVLESLTALELAPGTASLMAAFENEVSLVQSRVKAAVRDGAEGVLKTAYKDLEDIKERAAKAAETGANNPTFFTLHDAAEAALKKLESHPQRAHVQAKITEGRTALKDAISANGKKRYPESLTKLEAARLAAVFAKDRADKFNTYRVERAPAADLIERLDGRLGADQLNAMKGDLAQADLDASLAANKYAEATSAVKELKDDWGAALGRATEKTIQAQIDRVEKLAQLAFVAADHKELKDLLAAVSDKVDGEEWGGMSVLITRGTRVEVIATDKATRRQEYVDARKAAVKAIDVLRPNKAMADKVKEFETVLSATADPLATAQALRFAEAVALCEKVGTDCAGLADVAAAAKKFLDEKDALDKRLVALGKLPAAARMTEVLGSLAGLQSEAAKRAAPDVQDWAGGQEWLARMKADLSAAEVLAASLIRPMALQESAKLVGKAEDIAKAVELVRAEALKLDVEPFKALLATDLKGIRDACELALAKGKEEGGLDAAKQAFANAAELLAKAQVVQASQKAFDAALATVAKRLEDLVQLAAAGSYKAIEPKVKLVQPFLDQAKEAAKTRAYPAAMSALGQAGQAASVADVAAAEVKAYDLRAGPLATRCGTLKSGGDVVTDVEKLLADAKTAAADLRFADARKLLDAAEAKMEALKIKRLAKANPGDGGIATAADALLKLDGGEKLLDDFVETLSGEASFDLIAKLAEKRFGILLESDDGTKTLSAKAIWKAMASVPASHAKKNPSLKSVKRTKPDDGSSGAFDWAAKSMSMNGRPDDKGTENFDAQTRLEALGLPLDHDNENDPYAPKDDKPANLFSMTVLHEVGHAVDDRLGFMASKAGDAAYGGWIQYSDLGPIADAVATVKKYDKSYVLQLLNGQSPDAKLMPDGHAGGEAAWAKAKTAVDEWYALAKTGQIWYDNARSTEASIDGVVYQEAYAGRWVSYLLAERAKGITAYQWRAPGEWFAELYMAWFGQKLKDNHPFASWLKTL